MKIRSLTHWGLYDFHVEKNRLLNVSPDPSDPDPSPLGKSLINGNYKNRVTEPSVRKGYLNKDQGKFRGKDKYITVSWNEAIDLVAQEIDRVRIKYGNSAIYGGSYGWASAGRFHHALSQLHRFLACIGGYTESRNAYSFAAAEVILPHVIGNYVELLKSPDSWPTIIDNCELMICFGGMPLRNSQITNGGMGRHVQRQYMQAAQSAGIQFVNVSPVKADTADFLNADWLAIRPGTDVALMLGIAFELLNNNWHDKKFLETYCTGFGDFTRYLIGESDGKPKTVEWATDITGINPDSIRKIAKQMAHSKTMISLSWSLSRQQFGEQPYWMGITLAAMLGQIGLPGRGIGLGYGVENKVGKNVAEKYLGHLPRGRNPIDSYIPVARLTDMLRSPGKTYKYDGQTRSYPDIKLIYWSGGNPFHHHQDLNRLQQAWRKPDTIICHELVWNSTACHSDIVLPVASFLERNDIGGAPNEDILIAMKQALPPLGNSRTDFEIFATIAEKLDVLEQFTEGKTEFEWIEQLYKATSENNPGMPPFRVFWEQGEHRFPDPPAHSLFDKFRGNPTAHPLTTASGLIHLTSPAHGHARWHEPTEWLGHIDTARYPFHLISHQPQTRLHSQMEYGEISQQAKINGLEPIRMNLHDAQRLGLSPGDKVRVFNERGAFYAGLQPTRELLKGVLHIATGAWWEPDADGTCINGNPNAVTLDIGTSDIAQGPSALTCLVNIEKG